LAIGSALPETSVELETRVAKLESDVSHLRADVSEIKADLRARFDRVDTRLDHLESKVDSKIDMLTNMIWRAQIWAPLLYIALADGMFGTMARGFGWI
jgi:chaperonin cofactor prefoldin